MSPFRILVVGVLAYIFYRLLIRSGKPPAPGGGRAAGFQDGPVQDVLVEDPVCHTLIPKAQAVQLHHANQMYYFCSQKCCTTFLSTNKG